jgi:hypothetical protein
MFRPFIVLTAWGCAAAADPAPTPSQVMLAALAGADTARSELARDEAAWALERARLAALIAATIADTERLKREAEAAEGRRDHAAAKLAAAGSGTDLDAVRQVLAAGGDTAGTALARISAAQLPGTVPAVAEAAGADRFDAVVRALESAERAAGTVSVEIISGVRAGSALAVRVLRIAGAAAWWVALDGSAAGTVVLRDGVVVLEDAAPEDALRIGAALAQAEGRQPPSLLLLPAPASGATP